MLTIQRVRLSINGNNRADHQLNVALRSISKAEV
jgi:hypothetical protein